MQSITSTAAPRPKGGRRQGSRNKPRAFNPNSLLVDREQSATLLNLSISKIIRLEKNGVLEPVRLTPKGKVYHRVSQIRSIVGESEAV